MIQIYGTLQAGPAAPAIELIYFFVKIRYQMMDMEAVAKINNRIVFHPKRIGSFDAVKQFPKPFNPFSRYTTCDLVDKEL